MTDDIVIKVDGLWKRYGLPLASAVRGLANRLRKNYRAISKDGGPWALQDVSFEVKRGETLGIIGRNGAGKSTLLKILAGVTPPTRGHIEVQGRVFPMIELNAGIHPELTGRENVRLLGAIMGLSRQEVEAKIPAIGEFTELGEWFDRPVRKYSNGMLARLGFGVAMNVDVDILLIDEVLAVGDLSFQQRCFSHIERLRRSKVTIVFVSHSLRQLERISHRMIHLDNGSVNACGEPTDVLHAYQLASDRITAGTNSGLSLSHSAIVESTGEIEILSIKFLDRDGREASFFRTGFPMTIRLWYRTTVDIEGFNLGVRFNSADMILVSGSSLFVEQSLPRGEGVLDMSLDRLPFLRGVYSIDINFKAINGRTMYVAQRVGTFHVSYAPETLGNTGLVKTELVISRRRH
jgi:lipopolysaccharide transport system ATP-binding protein